MSKYSSSSIISIKHIVHFSSISFVIFNNLFGKKKVKAPEFVPIKLESIFGGAMSDVGDQVKGIATQSKDNFAAASQLTGDIVPLTKQLQEAPTLQGQDQAEYDNAVNTFSKFMEMAKTNSMNETATGIKSAGSALGLKGFNTNGTSYNQIASSIGAKNQASLNSNASETAANLLNFRSGLLNNVYQRLTNRFNATMGAQGQLTSQGEALFSTAFNAVEKERNYLSGIQSANAQGQFAADTANNAANQAMWSQVTGLGTSMMGMGGKK
jgi:hypothetical protein